jgi:hypothetical protein
VDVLERRYAFVVGRSSNRGLSRGTVAALAALALGFAALLPADAAEGKRGYELRAPSFEHFFFASATNDYSVFVRGYRPDRVEVLVDGALASATYEVPGRVTHSRIEADLGALGRISVGFRARVKEGGKSIDNGRCKGRESTNEKGVFVGRVEFHGELDFADASATRVSGNRFQDFRVVCSRHRHARASAAPFPGAARGRIAAAARVPGFATNFSALTRIPDIKPGPTWEFGAWRRESLGRIKVTREVHNAAYSGVTESAPGALPITATVEPPAPFVGSAVFSQDPGLPAAWSGSLAVELPGGGIVPLTGPDFAAALCRGSGEPEQRPCTDLLLAD